MAGQDLRNILLLFSILQEDGVRFFRVPKSTPPSGDKDLQAVVMQTLDSFHLIIFLETFNKYLV